MTIYIKEVKRLALEREMERLSNELEDLRDMKRHLIKANVSMLRIVEMKEEQKLMKMK